MSIVSLVRAAILHIPSSSPLCAGHAGAALFSALGLCTSVGVELVHGDVCNNKELFYGRPEGFLTNLTAY